MTICRMMLVEQQCSDPTIAGLVFDALPLTLDCEEYHLVFNFFRMLFEQAPEEVRSALLV